MKDRLTNYTIGEGMELPSKGLIYDTVVPSYVELRSMTARDEMKRLSPSSAQFKLLADIIDGCLIEKLPIKVYDMALGDYEYLLHRLRIVTYGDSYKMSLRCPHCLEAFDTEAHLETLEVKSFDKEAFEEARFLMLPRSGKSVTLNFQTPRMLDETEALVKEMKRKCKTSETNFELFVSLLYLIDTVDGIKLPRTELETFINRLPALDMAKILNTADKLNSLIGIENNLILDCPYCGGEVSASFRFGPEFFRPTNI